MAPIQVFVQTRRPHRSHGYYCAICPFSSGGNIIQKKKKKKNPTQIMTCAPAYGLGTSNKALRDTLMRAAWYELLPTTANCGKI